MAASCLLRSKSASAVTIPQFTDLLQRTWLDSRRFRQGRTTPVLPRRLGLAVSGGADSMALAYLCREWEKQNHKQRHLQSQGQGQDGDNTVSVTAFVVDHKARKESTQEANTVAGWLRNMGIKTQILPLEWPDIAISAFETHARRLRFQALGKACRDSQIEALLLGHHQDDNVETTIWRLSSGARGAGLAGIPTVARIPECHGFYGVSESGESVPVHPDEFFQSDQEKQKHLNREPVKVSTGGIMLCRPLLSLPKSNLVATCQENNVPFVSDPTNFDPTLTPRNAIRHLLSSRSFPRALQNPSILSLIGKSQDLIRNSDHLSDDILRSEFSLLDLSLASGSVTIQINVPFSRSISPADQENGSQSETNTPDQRNLSWERLHELQSLTLRRITELVSPFPDNHFSLSSYAKFTDNVFPTPSHASTDSNLLSRSKSGKEREKESGQEGIRKSFTLSGVLFQPIPSQDTSSTASLCDTNSKSTSESGTVTNWLLTRQPFMRHREPITRIEIPLQRPDHSQQTTWQFTPWNLWDNRFWSNPADDTSNSRPTFNYLLRPLKQADLTPLRNLQTRNKNNRKSRPEREVTFDADSFFQKLNLEAPGQSRLSLPVLTLVREGDGGGDIPLALPTLDLAFPGLSDTPWSVTWEWKYKMVDSEVLKLLGSK
ncbi:PP-loop family-domain-containing protein [Aspergillus crustosus]